MVINDIYFDLKDGRKAVLRSPKEEDAESTLEYLRISAGETNYILRYPEECDKYTLEGEKKLFQQMNESPNEAMIMCIVDGRVVGNCQIKFLTNMKTKHRANVAIALISEFWNQGIGTRMFRSLLEDFSNEKITLNSSPFGVAFYKAIGFVPTDEEKTVNGIRFTPMAFEDN
jgi:RimJ/RimL family protein N-acetyltransferase